MNIRYFYFLTIVTTCHFVNVYKFIVYFLMSFCNINFILYLSSLADVEILFFDFAIISNNYFS